MSVNENQSPPNESYSGNPKTQVAFRLDNGIIEALDRISDRQHRSRSNLVEMILATYCRAVALGKINATVSPWEELHS